jgi:hypothetical protein
LQALDLKVGVLQAERAAGARAAQYLCKMLAFSGRTGDNRRFWRAALMHCKV